MEGGNADFFLDIQDTVGLLKKSVISLETRFANRALRGTCSYRDLLTADILKSVIESNVAGISRKILLGT